MDKGKTIYIPFKSLFFLNEENREEFSSCVFIIVQYDISDGLKGFLV